MSSKIAFIGLGNMGGPMAANLVRAGHQVAGFDLNPKALEALGAVGGTPVSDVHEAVEGVDVVITMLPAGAHVREIYMGKNGAGKDGAGNGLLDELAPDTLLIDCSTIDVDSARAVAAAASERGHVMVDAPVSGGVGGATAGTLTFMVGGSDEAVARARPVLEIMGKTIVHAGGAGNGQAAKICNNMILGISMLAVSEAFNLGESLGLDAQALFDIASKSSGQCWSLTSYCPVPGPVPTSPANNDYKPGFAGAMMLKDLKLSQQAAGSSGARTPLGAQAEALYEAYCEAGGASRDFSGVVTWLKTL